jgi:hypothetical protein
MFDDSPKKAVRGDYDRRWLSDDFFDLIVWYRPDDTIHGFQLCYDKPYWERALTWLSDRGFSHMEVDSGEQVYPPTKLQSFFPMDLSLQTQCFMSSRDVEASCRLSFRSSLRRRSVSLFSEKSKERWS